VAVISYAQALETEFAVRFNSFQGREPAVGIHRVAVKARFDARAGEYGGGEFEGVAGHGTSSDTQECTRIEQSTDFTEKHRKTH
jgi:hypothetical protein